MPERFLLQILRSLVTHGILQSTRGVDGGYALDRRPEEISLLDVIEAVDGPLAPSLPAGRALSATSQRQLHTALERVTSAMRKQLSSVKVSQLLNHN